MGKETILIVDDEALNLRILNELLSPMYFIRACKSGEEAIVNSLIEPIPDLVLMDIMMPGIGGYVALEELKNNSKTKEIPIIFISGLDSSIDEEKGLQLGAVDYITKPFVPAIVLKRIKVHLDLKKARDELRYNNERLEAEVAQRVSENSLIQDITLNIILQLAETRDLNTANHISHTQKYIEILARQMAKTSKYKEVLSEEYINRIVKSAMLHDIGKLGIPDNILMKPGKLTELEFEKMKEHTTIGSKAIKNVIVKAIYMEEKLGGNHKSETLKFLEEAEIIAKYHHEKWDGTGYPDRLKAEEIPLSARLMALVDVFDALTTHRIYKDIWDISKAVSYIIMQKGSHFDPEIVETFIDVIDKFIEIQQSMVD